MSYINVQERQLPAALRYLGDLFSYRHLCWKLVSSDVRNRFRRTRLGILWAVIQPLSFALMIALVWGSLHNQLGYWEFALYFLSGHAAFEFISASIMSGQDAIISAGGYLKQARIPFFIFQTRVVLTALVFFLFEVFAFFVVSLAVGKFPPPGQHLLLIPAYLGVMLLFGLPLTILMSVLGTLYRDVRHISALALRALFLLSPIMLPREIFEQPHLKFMEFVNPAVPMLDMFRDPVLYGKLWDLQDVLVMSVWIVGIWALALVASASAGRKLIFAT